MTQTQRTPHIVEADLRPRHGAKRLTHRVPLSRAAIGRFTTHQAFLAGYFVSADALIRRRDAADLPMLSAGTAWRRYEDPRTGRVYRGVWAWDKLAEKAQVGGQTVRKLARGEHLRSPEFFTVIKVFRALGLELRAATGGPDDVDVVVKGW